MTNLSNRVRPLNIHKTNNPSLDLAGGDLLGDNSLSIFDGIGIVPKYDGSIIANKARKDIESGRITIPCEVFKIKYSPRCILNGEYFEDMEVDTMRTLDKLYSKGCRNIGFFGGWLVDAEPKKSVPELVEIVDFWLESHKDARVTLVDLHDGYYEVMKSFSDDNSDNNTSSVIEDTFFDYNYSKMYLEESFPNDLRLWFEYKPNSGFPYNPPIILYPSIRRKRSRKVSDLNRFRAAMLLSSIVSQSIAKVTGNIHGMYSFCALNQVPLISCGLGGFMSPYTVMCESGLLPGKEDKEQFEKVFWPMHYEFIHMLREETGLSNVFGSTEVEEILYDITRGHIDDIISEIGKYSTRFLSGDILDCYFLSEDILFQD